MAAAARPVKPAPMIAKSTWAGRFFRLERKRIFQGGWPQLGVDRFMKELEWEFNTEVTEGGHTEGTEGDRKGFNAETQRAQRGRNDKGGNAKWGAMCRAAS